MTCSARAGVLARHAPRPGIPTASLSVFEQSCYGPRPTCLERHRVPEPSTACAPPRWVSGLKLSPPSRGQPHPPLKQPPPPTAVSGEPGADCAVCNPSGGARAVSRNCRRENHERVSERATSQRRVACPGAGGLGEPCVLSAEQSGLGRLVNAGCGPVGFSQGKESGRFSARSLEVLLLGLWCATVAL